ncbi:hypothetical protein [Halorientalis salina]|uniref:hypothetical protein n=1 Tax=Halorientalis salina TaxID=2932266 RepID=UPI0010AD80F6|nr:hypothetical protein [Halorientalis salina]
MSQPLQFPVSPLQSLPELFGALGTLALSAAVLTLAYFFYREFRRDHRTGEHHFTWGVGVVALFLLGIAPGLVGLGLYLTTERGYPVHWLVAFAVVALVVVSALSYGVDTTTSSGVIGILVS